MSTKMMGMHCSANSWSSLVGREELIRAKGTNSSGTRPLMG